MRRDERVTDEMVEALRRELRTFKHDEQLRTALSAALSIEQTQPVKVKALEWEREPRRLFARSPFIQAFYEIRRFDMGQGRFKYKLEIFGMWAGPFFDTEDEAVACAQADYEQRILSALVNAQADADVVERLKEALKAAAEELDRISCVPRVTETSDIYDQFERAKFFADRGASAAWATVRSLRPAEVGSATSSKGSTDE